MTTRFVLVRHATCAQTREVLLGRAIDAPLDSQGEQQAAEAAMQVAAERPSALRCSPRLRARQTAAAIGAACGLPVQVDPALDEVDFGSWSGRRFDELEDDEGWRRWNSSRAQGCTPEGLRASELQAGIVSHLRALAERHDGETVVLVTHAEPIRFALLHALGLSVDEWQRIAVPPASVALVQVGTEVPQPQHTVGSCA